MFRRDLLLAVEQTLFTPQARLIGGLACIKLSKNGKGYDGMLNCLFEVVKNTVVNVMLNKPSMEDVRIKMEKKTRKETVEVKEEQKVEETVEVKEEQKVEETVEVKEEQKVEETVEVKEEKIDEIDALLAYVQEYENEKIMNESLEELLTDKELAEKYNVDELFDDYDYVDEYEYVDCRKEAVQLNQIFEEDKVIKSTNVEVVEQEQTVEEIMEENKKTIEWLNNVMDISGCSVEELFKKCEENREELNK
jgi:hypothetical protein